MSNGGPTFLLVSAVAVFSVRMFNLIVYQELFFVYQAVVIKNSFLEGFEANIMKL